MQMVGVCGEQAEEEFEEEGRRLALDAHQALHTTAFATQLLTHVSVPTFIASSTVCTVCVVLEKILGVYTRSIQRVRKDF